MPHKNTQAFLGQLVSNLLHHVLSSGFATLVSYNQSSGSGHSSCNVAQNGIAHGQPSGLPKPCHGVGWNRRPGLERRMVTWPDDGFQQSHPASQKLQVSLHVMEHLQTNGLSEIENGDKGGYGGRSERSMVLGPPGDVLPSTPPLSQCRHDPPRLTTALA